VPLQLCAALLLAAIAFLEPDAATPWLFAAVFLTNLVAATQDIATDGLAVELLSPTERGVGNGVQVAGYRVGMIVGGGALLIMCHKLGWKTTFLTSAALLLVATIPVCLFREEAGARAEQAAPPSGPAVIFDVFRRPGMLAWLGVLLTYKTGDALATGMLRPFLVDLGLEMDEIGWLLGSVGFGAGLVGALLGGWAVNRLGRRNSLVGFGGFQVVAVALYFFPAVGATSAWVLYGVCTLEHLAGGMATAALFTIMMDKCQRHNAATDYTVQASTVVIATGAAAAVSGFMAEAVGYPAHFLLASALSAAGLAFAWWVLGRPAAR
jgi:predicted MFS family arabinose efflux permease